MRTVAALYVDPQGVYADQPDVELWGVEQDARTYAGPHPVVAHPPCQRWGHYWSGGPGRVSRGMPRLHMGDDGGCFDRALWAVRTFGGVLEHPADSEAWAWFGLREPGRAGGWIAADALGGWTCCVAQGHYGHAAQKLTWLYALGAEIPPLHWGPCEGLLVMDGGLLRSPGQDRKRAVRTGICQKLSKRQRAATPPMFAELLLDLARSVGTEAQPLSQRKEVRQ